MEPVDVLRAALEAVEGAGIPEDLRPLAFTTAVDLVVAQRTRPAVPERPAPRPVAPARPTADAPTPTARADAEPAQDLPAPAPRPAAGPTAALLAPARAAHVRVDEAVGDLRGVAETLAVPVERLDRLFDAHGGSVELCVDPARLGRTKAERAGTAVLLLLAALRWSGRDAGAPVPDAVVRAEVKRLGLLDVGNYSKHLAARRGLWATSGSGRSASYRLRYDGSEEARRIAGALLDDHVP